MQQVVHPLRDGLWDDDEESCASPNSLANSFGWQSRVTSSTSVDTTSTSRAKSLRGTAIAKKDDTKVPKGKGRRGELRLALGDQSAYTGSSLPTIVSPNDSIATGSVPSSAPLKSPGFHRPLPQSPSISPFTPSTAASSSVSKPSTWSQRASQSLKRFGRSKSSGNLRATAKHGKSPLPPMPMHPSVLGLSHSTPPLGESSKVNQQPEPVSARGRTQRRSFTPAPPVATVAISRSYEDTEPISPFTIPCDPFSSPLYPSSSPSQSPLQPPASFGSRSKGPRSPSLRDMRMPSLPSLRDFRPSLTKTKSWASFPRGSPAGPTSAPIEQTSFFPTVPPSFPRAHISSSLPTHNHHLANSIAFPTESPPLLPPNPPYFPASSSPLQSPFLPSTPPPTSPLPLAPAGTTTPVLLPRSRSTSLSLKSPPTSSSFFDLYEQLGIWPSVDDQVKAGEPEVKSAETVSPANDGAPPERSLPSLPSEASELWSESWAEAIGSFPFVETSEVRTVPLDDDEDPGNMADTSVSTVDQVDWLQTPVDAGDESQQRQQIVSTQLEGKVTASGAAGLYLAPPSQDSAPRGRRGSSSSSDASRGGRRTSSGDDSESDTASETESDDDSDDVPLGQRIPGAVEVQRDMRAKEKARRQKRRKPVAKKALPRVESGVERVETLSDANNWNGEGGVAAEVLRRKLEAVAASGPVPGPSVLPPRQLQAEDFARHLSQRQAEVDRRPTVQDKHHVLRAQRSFANPQTSPIVGADLARRHTDRRAGPSTSRAPPLPPNAASTFSSLTRGDKASVGLGFGDFGKRKESEAHSHLSIQGHGPESSEMRSRQLSLSGSQKSAQSSRKPSLTPLYVSSQTRPESPSNSPRIRNLTKSPLLHLASEEPERSRSSSGSAPQPKAPLAIVKSEVLVQQRAFVGSLQGKALQLEIGHTTRARDVLDWATKNGDLARGGEEWVMYEIFAELGCERPLREWELLADVMHGWNQEARVNTFLFQQSRAAGKTLARAIPRVPPYVGGYVQYESKKGKWTKRWLETREGSIFVAKNDRHKDETFICLAASFDVYAMTRPYKAPKSFTFVLKSQDSAVLFEDPTDYLHVFSTEDSTAHKLVDAIYQARSTSLILDKPQLLHSLASTSRASAPSPTPQSAATMPSDVGTVRGGFLGRRKTSKPLVEVTTPITKSSPFTGGLLGRRL